MFMSIFLDIKLNDTRLQNYYWNEKEWELVFNIIVSIFFKLLVLSFSIPYNRVFVSIVQLIIHSLKFVKVSQTVLQYLLIILNTSTILQHYLLLL